MSFDWPHDDTASLISYYGKPWINAALLTHVVPPFQMKYEGALIHGIMIHKKCADALSEALQTIWDSFDHSQADLDQTGFTEYGGSYNYRNVRGATNLSCHAFGAALDCGASKFPLGSILTFDQRIIEAFDAVEAVNGSSFIHRKDPMHFQFAHE